MTDIGGPVRGTAFIWHREQGWGVLRSPDAPADVWCHYSAIRQDGYRELTVGETVTFTFEAVEQDGYHYIADEVRRDGTAGSDGPGDTAGTARSRPDDAAYQSRRTVVIPEDRRER